jgi:hypothetical protein
MPAVATPTAPTAPVAPAPKSAAPAPPPKASTPSTPEAPVAPKETNDFSDAFADLDALDQGKKPAAKKPDQPKEKPAAADAEEPDDVQPQVPEKETPTKPEELAKPEQPPAKPVKAAELRNAYEGLKKRVKEEFEPQLQQLKAKVAEYESGKGIIPKEIEEKIATFEKRNAELESHIKFVDYSKSKEYQEQYWKPYVQAWSNAVRELNGLQMTVEDPATGESTARAVTEADLQYFAGLEPGIRRTEINRLFPEDKEEVKRHINEISRLFESSQTALNKAREDAETHAKSQAEQQRQAAQNRDKLWKESNEQLASRYPTWFAPTDGDNEGNALLTKGAALSDLLFDPQNLTPERVDALPKVFKKSIQQGRFTPEHGVRLQAIVRNKAANHDRLVHQLNAAQTRISELEKSLKEYEQSSPDGVPAGSKAKAPSKGYMEDAASELEALDKRFA